MTGSSSEKIDPAHWISVAGGAVMMTVVLLCSFALIAPWWKELKESPGKTELIEVSLWTRYARTEMEADDTTLNCDDQCDITKLASSKTRESDMSWGDVCQTATDELSKTCSFIWVIRVCVLLCWFLALLYAAFSTLNFCGAGLPAAIRIPPIAKIGLAACCLTACLLGVVMANVAQVETPSLEPGTKPLPAGASIPQNKPGLSGIGFLCILAALLLSLLGLLIAYLAQFVINHLQYLHEPEEDLEDHIRELTIVNKAQPPNIDHQVGRDPAHIGQKEKRPRPPPRAIGAWMT